LLHRRIFLGWTPVANVVIGTAGFSLEVERAGESFLCLEGIHRTSYSLGLGTSGLPSIAANVGVQVAQAFDGKALHIRNRIKSLPDRMQDSTSRNLIIYDKKNIAWYIPEACILLYMAQLYLHRRGYSVQKVEDGATTQESSVFFATPDPDGGEAALTTLTACLDLQLAKNGKAALLRDGKVFTFEKLIDMLLDELESVMEVLHKSLPAARKPRKASPNGIIGVELLDVVHQKPDLQVKSVVFSKPQPWAQLAEDRPLVLFCKDLGQAITSANPNILCDSWKKVPESKDLFVTTVRAIKNLFKENGGRRLTGNCLWDIRDPLVSLHTLGVKSTIVHTQKLQAADSIRSLIKKGTEKDPLPLLEALIDGGLIFARPISGKGCKARLIQ
jgi:hypothetical protein